MSKNGQKSRFLMAKSSFSSFSTKLTQKLTENHQKLIKIHHHKMRSNLTIKRGDSGSAGMLEKNSVMIEAPKTDTKNDQKFITTIKIDKN